mmetsp:Transcript_112767/g.297811  ORF Transcript_112767/g.297811 Transcript_112767/m.297811 type:complete len:207 (+) Transcript_112767:131-751(+)
MSKATCGLGSTSRAGSVSADVTLVRPPTGMTAKPWSPWAASSRLATSSSAAGRTTASGARGRERVRRRQMSASPWPVQARSLASASVQMRSSASTAASRPTRPAEGGGRAGSASSGSVPRTLMDTPSSVWNSAHSWCMGCPPREPYLVDVTCIAGRPSTHCAENLVSLKPHLSSASSSQRCSLCRGAVGHRGAIRLGAEGFSRDAL